MSSRISAWNIGNPSSESLRRDVHFFGLLNMGRGPFAEIDTTLAQCRCSPSTCKFAKDGFFITDSWEEEVKLF